MLGIGFKTLSLRVDFGWTKSRIFCIVEQFGVLGHFALRFYDLLLRIVGLELTLWV